MSRNEDDDFVTVFSASDLVLVDMIAVKLRSAGIPVTHPGAHHCSVMGGIPVVPISMQVPRSQAAKARELIEEVLHGDSKVQRPRSPANKGGALGAVLGLGMSLVIYAVLTDSGEYITRPIMFGLLSLGTLGGYLLERWLRWIVYR